MTETKTQKGRPFKRASALYMQALELRMKFAKDLVLLQAMINGMPEYKSRGHGRTPPRMCRTNFHRSHSKYTPHQGKSECARRVFQALPAAQRAYIRSIEREVSAAGDLE